MMMLLVSSWASWVGAGVLAVTRYFPGLVVEVIGSMTEEVTTAKLTQRANMLFRDIIVLKEQIINYLIKNKVTID